MRLELFKRTSEILFQAYFNGTLVHNNCYACAVGNIIAGNCNLKFESADDDVFPAHKLHWAGYAPYKESILDEKPFAHWYNLMLADIGKSMLPSGKRLVLAEEQIESTGFTLEEITEIEFAFEKAGGYPDNDIWMYNGLVAVLDVLKKICDVTDEDLLPEKIRFNNHYQLITA